ncbi:GAF domain-containing protein [Persicobacter diffluens]|uniref:HAMP domain-containing protein n=1 Tax=Persicobacter diffluens TaxID=981 RepID=A0AAN4W2S8_9BACT|nr:hypothetical protein PEDI_41980 [Persicobacter diffluens]
MTFQFGNVRQKFMAACSVMVLISCLSGMLSYYLFVRNNQLNYTQSNLHELESHYKTALRYQLLFQTEGRKNPEFYTQGTTAEIEKVESSIAQMDLLITQLENDEVILANRVEFKINRIWILLQQYKDTFEQLKSTYRKRGFKDYGLEGDMRGAIHPLEETRTLAEKKEVLMLRRHEKDFMLRGDLKYQDKLQKTAADLKSLVKKQHRESTYIGKVTDGIENYVAHFNKLVAIEQTIGLNQDQGLQGDIKSIFKQITPVLEEVSLVINKRSQQVKNISTIALVSSLLINLLLGVAVAFLLGTNMTRPIKLLNQAVKGILEGKKGHNDLLNQIKTKDEIGSLAKSFKKMIAQINKQMSEINEQKEELQKAFEEDNKRKWVMQGINQMHQITKKDRGSVNGICDQLLKFMIDYIDLNQGAIFIRKIANEELGVLHSHMALAACYAYNRKKFIEKEILPGEGLVGTCWQEKETIVLTDIPEDHLAITSGLGESMPRHLFLVPMVYNEQVEGIIEVASFHEMETHHMELIKEMANHLGANLASAFSREQTQKLLQNSQQQAEELKAQEEELRQNMEELEATQEEMKRVSEEKVLTIEELRKQIIRKDEKIEVLKSKLNLNTAQLLNNY